MVSCTIKTTPNATYVLIPLYFRRELALKSFKAVTLVSGRVAKGHFFDRTVHQVDIPSACKL